MTIRIKFETAIEHIITIKIRLLYKVLDLKNHKISLFSANFKLTSKDRNKTDVVTPRNTQTIS